MSYVGSTPTSQSFISGTDTFTGNGSTTNWTLTRYVNSVNDIEIVVANVPQNPASYSVNGTTLTISPAVASGVTFYVRYLATTLQSTPWVQGAQQGVVYENVQTINADIAISSGKNSGSFGPITIAAGVNVTIPSDSSWTIV